MSLPLFKSQDAICNQIQTKWKSEIDPILSCPICNGQLLNNQSLINGTTIINHKLGRKLQGWIIVGNNGSATIYDNQSKNQSPQLTLSLTSNAAVTVNLWVF